MRLGTMLGAEVFEVGVHRGHYYSEEDLDQIVANFRLAEGVVEPPLSLGHEDNQVLMTELAGDPAWASEQRPTFRHNTGSPAIGWPRNLRREGTKLKADITHIPGKIADLMHARMLHKFSAEFYPSPPADAPPGCKGLMLKRVSVLGREQPQLKTLADWHGLLFGEGDVPIDPWVIRAAAQQHEAQTPAGTWEVFFEVAPVPDATTTAPATLPPGREQMIADLTALGADPAALQALPDDQLATLWQQKKAIPMSETPKTAVTPAPVAPVAPVTPAAPAPAPAAVTPPPAAPAPGGCAHALPADVVQKFAELDAAAKRIEAQQKALEASLQSQLASQQAAERLAKDDAARRQKTAVLAFCEQMVREGLLTPAQVETEKKTGAPLGPTVKYLLGLDAVRKFAEQPSALELAMDEIRARPKLRKYAEQVADPLANDGAALAPDYRRRLLSYTPLGKSIIAEEKKKKA